MPNLPSRGAQRYLPDCHADSGKKRRTGPSAVLFENPYSVALFGQAQG